MANFLFCTRFCVPKADEDDDLEIIKEHSDLIVGEEPE